MKNRRSTKKRKGVKVRIKAIFAKPENHTPSDVLELFENELGVPR